MTTKKTMTKAMKGALLTAALVTASSVPTMAQAVFVDGVAFAGVELRNHVDRQPWPGGESREDSNGTTAGGTIGIGTMLTPRLSARVEVGLPATFDRTADDGLILPAVIAFPPYTLTREVRDRARTVSALLAYHTGRRHGIQLAFVGGAAFVQRSIHQRVRYAFPLVELPAMAQSTIPRLGLTIPPDPVGYTTTDYSVAATAGIDADLAFGARVSVVPQIRVIGLDDGLSIRPGVGIRVKF